MERDEVSDKFLQIDTLWEVMDSYRIHREKKNLTFTDAQQSSVI